MYSISINPFRRFLVALVFFVSFSIFNAAWANNYLPDNTPDGLMLLPPPPSIEPAEQAADLAEAKAVYSHHTEAEWKIATSEIELTVYAFAPAFGDWFQSGKFPRTDAFFQEVEKETKRVTNVPKDFWKRSRPYNVDASIKPVAPEKSYSYPSGHSTRGTVYAALLAEIFPEKKEAILEIGRQIGWHRVLAGDHFPSDVFAGRVLGRAIARDFLKSEALRKDLAEVRAEILRGAAQ